jgi:hypothetical protein
VERKNGCRGHALVARQKRRIERLGERDIYSVIRGEVMPQCPHARQKEIVRVAAQRHICQVCQGSGTAFRLDFAGRYISTNNLRYFHVYQMWSVQCLPRAKLRRSTASAAGVRSASSKAEASTTITGDRVQR